MRALSNRESASLTLIQGRDRCIEEKPKNLWFSHKNPKMFDFRFNTPIHSLNQGQGRVFMLRECAESISRIKLPLGMYFLQKFKKKFFRRTGRNCYPPLTPCEVPSRGQNQKIPSDSSSPCQNPPKTKKSAKLENFLKNRNF